MAKFQVNMSFQINKSFAGFENGLLRAPNGAQPVFKFKQMNLTRSKTKTTGPNPLTNGTPPI